MKFEPTLTLRQTYGEFIRIRGTVQGVGFRPAVWSAAQQLRLVGSVQNDGDGVFIAVYGSKDNIGKFVSSIEANCPPLAVIESIERKQASIDANQQTALQRFTIESSKHSKARTHIPPDSATCRLCIEDISNTHNKRFNYAFTNCTHCGPRLSIIKGIPYDRAQTSMSQFALCNECASEYNNPSDRRFHAQPNACPNCGPQVCLEDTTGKRLASRDDAITQTAKRLKAGAIVAIKGIGGFHLAVDANNIDAIKMLRTKKRRPHKALALMAKDIAQVKRYCRVELEDSNALLSAAAPIVLLDRTLPANTESCVLAPRQKQLGFMLPYSPLHYLLMQQLDHPIVLTSGNQCNDPQCIDNEDARTKLCSEKSAMAEAILLHDRRIENRLDDSVIRYMAGEHRILRRARGYAPAPIKLHQDFAASSELLAMGGELKNTFCLLQDQQAVLSQHVGDLESYATLQDYQHHLQLYRQLYQHQPKAIVIDRHPEYLSSKFGKTLADELGVPVIEVQHHHAHIAACLAENQQSLSAKPVLGIALDGLGFGDDGALWGGEFLLADYTHFKRLACFKPVPLIGGSQAMKEPWRNTYAHLQGPGRDHSSLWRTIEQHHNLDIVKLLNSKPLSALDQMLTKGINSPLSTSCGRLFDAVAAALGICSEKVSYEGQAAIELESLIQERDHYEVTPYDFNIVSSESFSWIDATPMWQALIEDIAQATAKPLMSARFHFGLAQTIIKLAKNLIQRHDIKQVALSGGVMQNKILLEALVTGLQNDVEVLSHRLSPANDGGLALGQAAIAAALQLTIKTGAKHVLRNPRSNYGHH